MFGLVADVIIDGVVLAGDLQVRQIELVPFLLILGEGGVAEAGPELISEIIVGLRMVGLEEDARRLAIEAALQGGM